MRAQALEWLNGFPAIGVVFYNDPCPWYLNQLPSVNGFNATALVLWPERARHLFDAKPLLERVIAAVGQRLNIPHEFPAEL